MQQPESTSHLLDMQPDIVRTAAERKFQSLRRAVEEYRFTGRSNAYRWRHHDASTFHFQQADPGSILDVGAGAGSVVEQLQQWGHEAHGVTAYTYGSTNSNLHEGDVNRLSQLKPLHDKRFDAVISRWTLRHLTDPLCCLEQMANMTVAGGELITDDFGVNSISSTTTTIGRHVMDRLFDAGFVPATAASKHLLDTIASQAPLYPNVPSLHLRKTSDANIELPVTYDVSDSSWAYRIT